MRERASEREAEGGLWLAVGLCIFSCPSRAGLEPRPPPAPFRARARDCLPAPTAADLQLTAEAERWADDNDDDEEEDVPRDKDGKKKATSWECTVHWSVQVSLRTVLGSLLGYFVADKIIEPAAIDLQLVRRCW